MPTHERREDVPGEQDSIEEPSPDMIEAGAQCLYGRTRAAAIELDQEDKFQACCEQVRKIYYAMMLAKFSVSQQQLAEGEPVNNPPLLW